MLLLLPLRLGGGRYQLKPMATAAYQQRPVVPLREHASPERSSLHSPQQSTMDQDFQRKQFIAYRNLGFQIVRRSPDLTELASALATGKVAPRSEY